MLDLKNFPRLWVQSGDEVCARINFLFARQYLDKFVLRLTGGCSNMSSADAAGLHALRAAMNGYSGVGLFGGTNIRRRNNPYQTVDSITEIFPSLSGKMLRLGIVAKTEDFIVTPYGVVTHDNPKDKETFAVMHTGADALLALQPSADKHSPWEAEFKECVRISVELQSVGWGACLVVFNGGGITEKELLTWARLGGHSKEQWQVLLIRGSGRVADTYANDKTFCREHLNVNVCDNSAESIRQALLSLRVPFTTEENSNVVCDEL